MLSVGPAVPVFERSNDVFGRRSMTDRVALALLLSRLGLGCRAF
jgi:hypothetical protein